jgi:hypothetical protein
MRHETPADRNGISEPGRPYWLVGLALLGLVLAILGGAFMLDRQLRPRVEVSGSSGRETTRAGANPTERSACRSCGDAYSRPAAPTGD